jgi:hypothetical protein
MLAYRKVHHHLSTEALQIIERRVFEGLRPMKEPVPLANLELPGHPHWREFLCVVSQDPRLAALEQLWCNVAGRSL